MRRETWRRATTPFGKTFVTPSSWTIRCSDESRTNSLGLLCRDRQAEPSEFGTGRKGATNAATLTSVDGVLDHGSFSFIRLFVACGPPGKIPGAHRRGPPIVGHIQG